MLASLTIRDVVLIDRLELTFEPGLCVLTGETGAGKSILLDSLGLAIGSRADQRLLRPQARQASVSAAFELPAGHPARALLAEHGLDGEDDMLVLRRTLGADGRSRAYVNDQPVSVGLLRGLGDSVIEVQGQFDARGLLDAATHRGLLDAFGGLETAASEVAAAWQSWREAVAAAEAAEQELAKTRDMEALLRNALADIEGLDPKVGECDRLEQERALLRHGAQLADALNAAVAELAGEDGKGGAEPSIAAARRGLDKVADQAAGRIDPLLEALDRAAAETAEALLQVQTLAADLDLDPARLPEIEERFFAIKELARKHETPPDRLPELRDKLVERLAALDSGNERLEALEQARDAARGAYQAAAGTLSQARSEAARALDAAVAGELPPLKLEKARFVTRLERLDESDWGPQGLERVAFEIATNPGSTPGPLGRIASGGELSRFLLALKVVLAGTGEALTLVFDEVDSAIGGATAHAVGERLAQLAEDRQVLVVTHSPQVAARGAHHWRVSKEVVAGNGADGTGDGERVATRVGQLSPDDRREELARMLSGARVTDEARAAADRLIGAA